MNWVPEGWQPSGWQPTGWQQEQQGDSIVSVISLFAVFDRVTALTGTVDVVEDA